MNKGCELLLIITSKVTGFVQLMLSKAEDKGKVIVDEIHELFLLKMKHLALYKHLNATLVIVQYST